jgi:hypothetical protein
MWDDEYEPKNADIMSGSATVIYHIIFQDNETKFIYTFIHIQS